MLLDEKEFERVFKNVSKTADGCKLISHYISFCGCDYFNAITDDARRDAFLKGKAFVGGNILNTLKSVNLDAYINILKEEEHELKKLNIEKERQEDDE